MGSGVKGSHDIEKNSYFTIARLKYKKNEYGTIAIAGVIKM